MRKESDFFDCLECGHFSYVPGINTTRQVLLEALQDLLAMNNSANRAKARAAIAKATGSAS